MFERKMVKSTVAGSMLAMALISMGLAGCGSTGNGGTSNKALKIATEFPVSGGDATDTIPAQNGVDLAVSQANLPNGYTLSFVHKDDEGTNGADASKGAANVQALANDSSVMAIVGPFNSGVAAAEIPIDNSAGIVEISPTNTNPGLTIQQYAAAYGIDFNKLHPSGKPDYYFRVCANDVAQGAVDAQIALSSQVHAKTAYVIDDTTAYGVGLANYFTSNFTQGGGTIVGSRQEISQAQVANLPALATTIAAAKPDVVFYGGVTSQGGAALKADLVQKGYTGYMVGGDGIADDPGFIQTAGPAAVGTIGTVAAPDVATLEKTNPQAATFAQDYKAKFGSDPLPYSAQAYDAANIEIQAIKNLITAGKDVTRANIRDQISTMSYNGITGTIKFDANGDNAGQKVFSVFVVGSDDKWSFYTQVSA